MRSYHSIVRFITVIVFSLLIVVALNAEAATYSDVPSDAPSGAAIEGLTERGIVEGNPDGTFAPGRLLNRAEFTKVAVSLHPQANGNYPSQCFPDVTQGSWYERYVCRAKTLGIVSGNPPPSNCQFRCVNTFAPERVVNYAEAVKILDGIFALPIRNQTYREEWYDPYFDIADQHHLLLSSRLRPDASLTRAQMAELVYNFVLYREHVGSSSSSRSSSSRSSSSRSSSSSSASSSSISSLPYDPLPDVSVRSRYQLLGETSGVLGVAKIFSNLEPVDITDITVTLAHANDNVQLLLLYDGNRRLIGTATKGVSSTYTAHIPIGVFVAPRREEVRVYVRASLRSYENGGTSGADLTLAGFDFAGNGQWSSQPYTQYFTDSFLANETARATITRISNARENQWGLSPGEDRLLGTFRIEARRTDGGARPRVTDIVFSLEQIGTTATNIDLVDDVSGTRESCSVVGSTVTCSGIPENIGSVTEPRLLSLYGDLAVTNPAIQYPSFRVVINRAGLPTNDGDVTFSDGSATFDWIPLDSPVASATLFK